MKVVQPIRDSGQIKAIAAFLKNRNERDYMLFSVGIYTGLRIADLLKLQVKDVKNKTHIYLYEGKTKKAKNVKISPKLQKILAKYIAGMNDEDYLFKSRVGKNKPISRVRAYAILKEAAREFGLTNIGTHSMRKTFGYFMYKKTEHNVALLQDLFNHSSPEITLRYIGITQDNHDQAIDTLDFF